MLGKRFGHPITGLPVEKENPGVIKEMPQL